MVMHNPPHPGEVIKELCIEPLGLTVTDAAKGLGVPRKTLSAIQQNKNTRNYFGGSIGLTTCVGDSIYSGLKLFFGSTISKSIL